MTRFARLMIAATAALSIAVTPMTASAEPDGEDIARALAGLAILGIVAKAASDRNERRDRARVTRNQQNDFGRIEDDLYYDRYDRDGRRVIRGDIDRHRRAPKDGRGYKKAELPNRCLLTVDTGRREFLAYGNRCLNRHYKFANKLPRDCQWQVRTDRGIRTVYGARCLRNDGWRVAGRY